MFRIIAACYNYCHEYIYIMFKSYKLIAAVMLCGTLTSCFKDEPLNAECDIEEAYIHADDPQAVFFQPSDSLVRVGSTETTIVFKQLRAGADLTALAPQFRITEGARIVPESGSVHDFSQGPVEYKVTSEDGEWSRTYQVRITAEQEQPKPVADTLKYDFEHYFLETTNQKYYVWSDLLPGGDEALNWASGNGGFAIARGKATPDQYPTTPLAEGYDGAGVKLTTSSTGSFGVMMNMRIAAGNLFTGKFDSKTATKQPLEATHFGEGANNAINFKPLKFEGYYQYTPGEKFQDKLGKVQEGKVDQGDIYAIVYKNTDADGNEFHLDGNNVLTSQQIVAKALSGHVDKTEGWTKFSIDFNYTSELDPAVLANYGYSLAIVFTSSCEGAAFEGAVGSTLLIDKVRVVIDRTK